MTAIRTQSTPALDKAITILEALGRSPAGSRLPDLVQQTGLPKSTIHCLVITLERRGYLYRKERTGRYVLGLKLSQLGNQALSCSRIREIAEPSLRRLMEATRLTVHMGILDQGQAVLVAKIDPLGKHRLATWVGKRMDVHCTGVGKAIAAHLSLAELERVMPEYGLPRHNDNTIATFKRLREDLERTVECGYSIDDEEDELGFRCIGAPIFGADRKVVASVSVAGTADQVNENSLNTIVQQLHSATAAITSRMLMEQSPLFEVR